MSSRNLTREEMLSSQYEMLKEIHRVCVENGLKYFLAYGTLIGAVRHHGFIPWDDDVDIIMPIDDYEKLFKVFKSERYILTDCYHDKRHQLCFPRMYDGYTCRDNNDNTLGVYIDIYLLHGAPDNQLERAKHVVKLMKLCKLQDCYTKWRGRFARHFFPSIWNHYESIVSTWLCRKQYRTLLQYKYGAGRVAYPFGGFGLTHLFWKDFFNETILQVFEKDEFYVPYKYHEILSSSYGDYMKLPPENERHPLHGSSSFCWKSNIK